MVAEAAATGAQPINAGRLFKAILAKLDGVKAAPHVTEWVDGSRTLVASDCTTVFGRILKALQI